MKTMSAAICLSLALGSAIPFPARAQAGGAAHGAEHGTAAPSSAGSHIDEAMDRMMMDMQDVELTGDPDADFLLMMIPHHRSAVDMAKAVLPEIDDPEVRELARTVIASQEAEIAAMQAMLERLGHAPIPMEDR